MSSAAQAAQAAQEAAARINQQLGVSAQTAQKPPNPHANLMASTEEFRVPDRMVGLREYRNICIIDISASGVHGCWELIAGNDDKRLENREWCWIDDAILIV